MKSKKQTVLSGVLILTVSNLLVKLIGVLFKIPLQGILGDQGMGYFNAAYSVYIWFYTLSTAGLPVAVSLLVAKRFAKGDENGVKCVYRTTMQMLTLIGSLCCLCMLLFSKSFAALIGSDATAIAIEMIAPTVLFVCVCGGIRGYFQGMGDMTPTALSQVIEGVLKLLLGILLAKYALQKGASLPVAAAYSVSGLTIGSFLSMLYLLWQKKHRSLPPLPSCCHVPSPKRKTVAKSLLRIALPVTLSASVLGLMGLMDVMLVIRCLRGLGYAEESAVALYGNYTTLALPMFHLPATLVTPLASAIVPAFTQAVTQKRTEDAARLRHTALRMAMLLLLPCSVGLSVFAAPILSLLFSGASVALAAPMLSVLALAIPCTGLFTVTSGLLQACRQPGKPMLATLLGAGVKLISAWLLLSSPAFGIYGAPLSTLFAYFVMSFCNLFYTVKHVGSLPNLISWFFKPFTASLGCVLTATAIRALCLPWMGNVLSTLTALFGAVLTYLVLLCVLRTVEEKELTLLPKGDRLVAMLRRLGFFRRKKEQTV